MNKFLNAAFGILLVSASANVAAAKQYQDVVYDSHGGLVHSTYGDCVRTQWVTEGDKCHHKRHNVAYDQIMQMDERIIYFDFDKSLLKDGEKDKLDVLARVLTEHNVKAVKIVGYADRIGTHQYNQGLSSRRAHAVKNYLDSKVKLDRSTVHLRALGEKNQVKGCHDVHARGELIDCLAPNRRVEVEVDYFDQQPRAKKAKK